MPTTPSNRLCGGVDFERLWLARNRGDLSPPCDSRREPVLGFPGITHTYAPDAGGWTEQWVMFEGPQAACFERLGFFSATQPVYMLPNTGAIEAIFTQLAADFTQGGHLTSVLGAALFPDSW